MRRYHIIYQAPKTRSYLRLVPHSWCTYRLYFLRHTLTFTLVSWFWNNRQRTYMRRRYTFCTDFQLARTAETAQHARMEWMNEWLLVYTTRHKISRSARKIYITATLSSSKNHQRNENTNTNINECSETNASALDAAPTGLSLIPPLFLTAPPPLFCSSFSSSM